MTASAVARALGWPGFLISVLLGLAWPAVGTAASIGLRAGGHSVASVPGGPSADGQNRQVRIHNQTGWTLSGFSIESRPVVRPGDLLGGHIVTNGDSWIVDVDDGSGACVYDFRVRFANGQSLDRPGINVCQIADYYLTR